MNANTSDETSRVLVVGAGPVGLVVACELARRGVGVRLIDKLTAPTQESRAIIVHARSLEMMERIGTVDALIDSGVKLSALEMHADGELLGRVELGTVDSPYPFSVSTAQTETERVLAERLEALGVTIDRGVELVGLEQDDREVRSILRHADGSEELFVSSWIVGADGSHSTVRDQVGTKLEVRSKAKPFFSVMLRASTNSIAVRPTPASRPRTSSRSAGVPPGPPAAAPPGRRPPGGRNDPAAWG